MMKRMARHAGMVAVLTCVSTAAAAQDSFFAGREVRLIVGTGAGGGYDTYARLVARYLGDHIPGNPSFVVSTMPGASGVKAVNYLYSTAPKDGSVIATFNNAMPVYQAVGQPGIQFKCEELSWLASMSQLVSVVAVWHTAGVKTIEDAKKKEIIMGATGAGGTMAGYPALINHTLGTKFKIVTGYEGGNQLNLAMERGEVQGRGTLSWSSVQSIKPDWFAEKKVIPLVQIGPKKEPDLPHVPLLIELAQNDVQRQMFQFVTLPSAMERPFAGPPGIPADRVNLLRRGFDAMVKSSDFLATAKKQDIDLVPSSGEEVEKIVAAIVGTPHDIVEKTRIAMAVKDTK
jgi:tripartite-type tricarboxylate transporter receptor subunit TctC